MEWQRQFRPRRRKHLFPERGAGNFPCYYPYKADATYTDVSTSAENQSTANQPKIDFLYAEGATASKNNSTVNFTGDNAFTHRMSQITIKFTEGSDMDFDGLLTGYTLSGLVLKGSFDTATGEAAVTGTTPEPLEITLSDVTATNKVYTAAPVIVFPQSASGHRPRRHGGRAELQGQAHRTRLQLCLRFAAGRELPLPRHRQQDGIDGRNGGNQRLGDRDR